MKTENKIIISVIAVIVLFVGYGMFDEYTRDLRIKSMKYDNIQLQHEINTIDRYLELCEKMSNCE